MIDGQLSGDFPCPFTTKNISFIFTPSTKQLNLSHVTLYHLRRNFSAKFGDRKLRVAVKHFKHTVIIIIIIIMKSYTGYIKTIKNKKLKKEANVLTPIITHTTNNFINV